MTVYAPVAAAKQRPPAADLTAELVAALGPGGERLVDSTTRRRAEYTTDASNYRVVPQAVVFPRNADDVQAIATVCGALSVPITSRGASTSVAGNAIGPGVILDFCRPMNRILDIDPKGRSALVQPSLLRP